MKLLYYIFTFIYFFNCYYPIIHIKTNYISDKKKKKKIKIKLNLKTLNFPLFV